MFSLGLRHINHSSPLLMDRRVAISDCQTGKHSKFKEKYLLNQSK
jgi:hypothetical protein